MKGLIDSIRSKTVTITSIVKKIIPGLAAGGIVTFGQERLIGEAGPEAVVPLNRPLSQVDPSVRMLSAIAQGMGMGPTSGGGGGGGGGGAGRQVHIGEMNLHSPSADPRVVAREFVNQLAAVGY